MIQPFSPTFLIHSLTCNQTPWIQKLMIPIPIAGDIAWPAANEMIDTRHAWLIHLKLAAIDDHTPHSFSWCLSLTWLSSSSSCGIEDLCVEPGYLMQCSKEDLLVMESLGNGILRSPFGTRSYQTVHKRNYLPKGSFHARREKGGWMEGLAPNRSGPS